MGQSDLPAQPLELALTEKHANCSVNGCSATIPRSEEELRTTVILRNLPEELERDAFMELLNTEGFQATFNFLYMPMDFVKELSLGYAFVSFVSHEEACRACDHFNGLSFENVELHATWSDAQQGLADHVERFKNSPVMHIDVPDKFRPLLLSGGTCVAFPEPTKKIRRPRIRHVHSHQQEATSA